MTTLILIVKLTSLFVLLWFGYVALHNTIIRRGSHWVTLAVPAAASVAFAWSMGWLS